MENLEKLMSMNWIELAQYLILPACILCASVAIGIAINRALTEKIQRHIKKDESDIKEIFFRAMQGVPISLSFVIGLY